MIDIPCFALQAAVRCESGLGAKPVVLVDASLAKPVVVDMTWAAEREGVLRGLGLPQALARCPEVLVRYRSMQGEEMAGRTLFDCAYSLSPRVEESEAGVCTIDLQGVLSLIHI